MSDLLWQKPGVAVDAQIQAFLAGDDVLLDREFRRSPRGLGASAGMRTVAPHG